MTRYTVIYTRESFAALTRLWLTSFDRSAIARAGDGIDRELRDDALRKGCRVDASPINRRTAGSRIHGRERGSKGYDLVRTACGPFIERSLNSRRFVRETMNPTEKPNRLGVWGHCMTNPLPGSTRKRRKREASKRRRVIQRREVEQRFGDLN